MKNFKRKHITTESYFLYLINYIHLNPVSHGYVSKPGDWGFSSYNGIVSDRPSMVKRQFVLEKFEGVANFIQSNTKPM